MRIWIAAALVGLAGCADGGPKLVPAGGRLTLAGKPVKGIIVRLVPVGESFGNGSFGMTNDDGRFTMTDVRGEPGVYPGEYRVELQPGPGANRDDPATVVWSPANVVPKVYTESESPLRAAVPDGGATLAIDLPKAGPDGKVTVTPGPPAP